MVDQLLEPNPVEELQDRRRPGRIVEVSPALVPLLRDPARSADNAESLQQRHSQDQLAIAKGLAWGIALSLPLWMLIAWLAHVLID